MFHRFAILAGATKDQLILNKFDLNRLANTLTHSKDRRKSSRIKEMMKKHGTVGFFFVRNPITRLISAYRDKIECREGREFYYQVFTL